MRDRIWVAWQRDRPVTGGTTAPQSWVTFWPKFKRPQNFSGVLGKIFGGTLLKPPTVCNRRPPLRTPLYP